MTQRPVVKNSIAKVLDFGTMERQPTNLSTLQRGAQRHFNDFQRFNPFCSAFRAAA